MQLASFTAITELRLNHKGGAFETGDGQEVSLRECWIVAAKYGRKRFDRDGSRWFLECSSQDAATGTTSMGDRKECGSRVECGTCKPVLWLGVVGAGTHTPYLIEVNASAAKKISSQINRYARAGYPPFLRRSSIRTALTEKSSSMTYTQVHVNMAGRLTTDAELDIIKSIRPQILAAMEGKGAPMGAKKTPAPMPSLGM